MRDAAVRAAASETEHQLGPFTLLVNNAGTPGPAGLDWEVDPEAWFECIDVIVRGAFLLSQAVVPGMIARWAGRIINIASITGIRPSPRITATSVAKTALIRFSEGLAVQLEAHGICVFAVHPGVVRTRLLESYGLQIPEARFVGAERAGSLCARLASGRYDLLSGRFLGIDDDPTSYAAELARSRRASCIPFGSIRSTQLLSLLVTWPQKRHSALRNVYIGYCATSVSIKPLRGLNGPGLGLAF